MKVSIVEDHGLSGIFVRFVGVFTAGHSIAAMRSVRAASLYRDDVPILNDYARADMTRLSMKETYDIARSPRPNKRDRRAALVHDTQLGFSLCRAAAQVESLSGLRTHAYRTVAEAMDWLYPGQDLTEVPTAVAALHEAHLGPGPYEDPELEISLGAVARPGDQDREKPR